MFPAALILVVFYMFLQLFSGERGLFTWHALRQQVAYMKTENELLKSEIQDLEVQAGRLYGQTLDWDYVDEQARKTLPVLKESEEVIFLIPKEAK